MTHAQDRLVAVIVGAAVGDALGGAVEGYSPEQIRERHGGPVTGIVGPWFADWENARPMSPYHKGDGLVTDDILDLAPASARRISVAKRVKLDEALSQQFDIQEISEETVPFDFSRNRRIHRCWEIRHPLTPAERRTEEA